MYDTDIDTTPTRRSFRIQGQVYSIVLEAEWWMEFDRACPWPETRKTWIMEWIQDAADRGCNRQALIRYRIHQLTLEDIQGQSRDHRRELMEHIDRLRKKRMPWAKIASLLSEVELLPAGGWSGDDVKAFYYKHKEAQVS
jgi:hypothetical protein